MNRDLIKKGGWGALALILAAALVQTLLVHVPHHARFAADQLELHRQVLAGTAQSPYQYQMYFIERPLETLFRLLPRQDAPSFARLYQAVYGLGLLVFLVLLFRLCLRFGPPAAAAMAVLYLVALLPLFWYDNYYHPSDPWGAALAVILIARILDRRPWTALLIPLLASSLLWEKAVLLPVCLFIGGFLEGERKLPQLLRSGAVTALLCLAAVAGQLYTRWISRGSVGTWDGVSLATNLAAIPLYLAGMAVVFGPALTGLGRHFRQIPPPLRVLALQIPLFIPIYLVMGGVLAELRGVLILVPALWPALTLLVSPPDPA